MNKQDMFKSIGFDIKVLVEAGYREKELVILMNETNFMLLSEGRYTTNIRSSGQFRGVEVEIADIEKVIVGVRTYEDEKLKVLGILEKLESEDANEVLKYINKLELKNE